MGAVFSNGALPVSLLLLAVVWSLLFGCLCFVAGKGMRLAYESQCKR